MRQLLLPVLAVALLGMSSPSSAPRAPEAQAKLDKALAGRVAGQPERCLRPDKTASPIAIDDNTILFRDGPRIWRNDLERGFQCGDLRGRKALVRVNTGLRICRGDTLNVIDMNDGSPTGACVLGDFVPYSKPKS